VCTSKRPVPLEHFLYTGNSAKTSKELFLLVDSNSKLQELGWVIWPHTILSIISKWRVNLTLTARNLSRV